MTDPFDILGLPPSMDLDARELEHRYLALSRENHPDFHAQGDPGSMTAVLARSAEINDAYRVLRDPWKRARALAERLDPGVLERKKQLCPATLIEAMDLAEEVAFASPDEFESLEQKIRRAIETRLVAVRQALNEHRTEDAAVKLHEVRYYQKALTDLRDRGDHA